ncbi:acyltransferase [Belnapia sp. T18]|uniref:Acyltransferase n=1 Tax=Belnapia arida TaxID=2804533 RepID=A0ABS1UDK6_9PROT|nr:acyltransferase [Belnapia arida]MBL6082761.1 acyltransferase [Belnapia arida]
MKTGEYRDEHNNTALLESDIDRPVKFQGNGNIVRVGKNVILKATIDIRGDNNTVTIGEWSVIDGYIGFIRVNDACVDIGHHTTIGGGSSIQLHETSHVHIGADCMISSSVLITVSDMHPIFDEITGNRINPGAAVSLADHVWVGYRSYVGRGASVGAGSVIGAQSVVSGTIPPKVTAAGVPARVIREGIRWERNFPSGDRIML